MKSLIALAVLVTFAASCHTPRNTDDWLLKLNVWGGFGSQSFHVIVLNEATILVFRGSPWKPGSDLQRIGTANLATVELDQLRRLLVQLPESSSPLEGFHDGTNVNIVHRLNGEPTLLVWRGLENIDKTPGPVRKIIEIINRRLPSHAKIW